MPELFNLSIREAAPGFVLGRSSLALQKIQAVGFNAKPYAKYEFYYAALCHPATGVFPLVAAEALSKLKTLASSRLARRLWELYSRLQVICTPDTECQKANASILVLP